ncbi:hypothetical protein KKG48_02555 [Patescibacteria group bacterium]|nr:hypothetical protein [Patescibacteria group bacterium]MCG2694802.1 hypothetical protein [Candidatus Parcubacteria bacterium]
MLKIIDYELKDSIVPAETVLKLIREGKIEHAEITFVNNSTGLFYRVSGEIHPDILSKGFEMIKST